ncbi:hypothetical protein FI667_g12003, partial [Globisporangium splendens]
MDDEGCDMLECCLCGALCGACCAASADDGDRRRRYSSHSGHGGAVKVILRKATLHNRATLRKATLRSKVTHRRATLRNKVTLRKATLLNKGTRASSRCTPNLPARSKKQLRPHGCSNSEMRRVRTRR